MVIAASLQTGYILWRQHRGERHDDSTPLGQTKHFFHRILNTLINTLFLGGGVVASTGLASYLQPTPSLPPVQQLLNAACRFSEGSNIEMVCDMSVLNLIMQLFLQPTKIVLWIGVGIIVAYFIVVTIRALCLCLCAPDTNEANENSRLQLPNTDPQIEVSDSTTVALEDTRS